MKVNFIKLFQDFAIAPRKNRLHVIHSGQKENSKSIIIKVSEVTWASCQDQILKYLRLVLVLSANEMHAFLMQTNSWEPPYYISIIVNLKKMENTKIEQKWHMLGSIYTLAQPWTIVLSSFHKWRRCIHLRGSWESRRGCQIKHPCGSQYVFHHYSGLLRQVSVCHPLELQIQRNERQGGIP